MLKLQSISSSKIISCITSSAQSSCKQIAPKGATATQKYLTQTQQYYKKYVIANHYEFDQKVINSERPVIVDFHADWCEPCKILTPKMTKLLENSEDIDLAIINVDNNTELVETFEVRAVPAILAFRNGVVVDKFIGLVDATSIDNLIKKLMPNKSRTDTGNTNNSSSDASNKSDSSATNASSASSATNASSASSSTNTSSATNASSDTSASSATNTSSASSDTSASSATNTSSATSATNAGTNSNDDKDANKKSPT